MIRSHVSTSIADCVTDWALALKWDLCVTGQNKMIPVDMRHIR